MSGREQEVSPHPATPELIRQIVNSRPWWHRIDLGNGIITPGEDDSPYKLSWLRLPARLDGKTVLDIGAYDGYFSFEAERRGAARVLATDHSAWNFPTGMGDGRGFDIARWALRSRVEKQDIEVENISPQTVGTFDYVLFLGVLYHSQDPMRYLRNVFSVTREVAIIETHVDGGDYNRPIMVFYPGDTLDGDASNYWGPNKACLVAMLREVGFRRVEVVFEGGKRLAAHAFRD